MLLRSFVSFEKNAAPTFEMLAGSVRSVIDDTPRVLRYLDGNLPTAHRGKSCVSCSLDAKDLNDSSFSEAFARKIRLQDLEPSRIILEVCECDALSETAWQHVIPELAAVGFRVVVKRYISDNGGFDILASPHVAGIKIAPSVVAGLPGSMLVRQFLRGLKSLSQAVKKQLFIDGVETIDQALWLETMGFETFQGHYYAPAMDVVEARSFVLDGRQEVARTILIPL